MPLGEEITGICRRCANSVSSRDASDSVTPWPTKMTGRFAFENQIDASRNFIGRSAAALRVQRRRRPRHFNVILFLKDIEGHVDIHRVPVVPESIVVVA